MGRAGDLHRPVLGTAARVSPDRRRHLWHAVLAVSVREFQFRLDMGGGAARARRCGRADLDVAVERRLQQIVDVIRYSWAMHSASFNSFSRTPRSLIRE